MKPVDVKSGSYNDFDAENNEIDSKLVIMWECLNTEAFSQTATLQIGRRRFCGQVLYHGYMLLLMSRVKKFLEHFMKNSCKRQVKQNLGLKK